jgi:hypothetical protein
MSGKVYISDSGTDHIESTSRNEREKRAGVEVVMLNVRG